MNSQLGSRQVFLNCKQALNDAGYNQNQIDEAVLSPSYLRIDVPLNATSTLFNLPVLVIMLGALAIGRIFFPNGWGIFAIGGFLLAWFWWSYTLPRWRKWAIQKGADAEALHRAAVLTGLEWPKGWIFEKTEIKVKK